MAKVLYTAVVAEVTGRLAGSVFQRSIGGNILRSLAVPINRRTTTQQRVRSSLAATTSAWRYCSEADKLSWAGGTNRERFQNYTAFNWLYMWLLSSKECVQVSPSPATMPNDSVYYIAHNAPNSPVFGIYGADDAHYADAFQWFLRITKPRQLESDPPGEFYLFRGSVPIDFEDNQFAIPMKQYMPGFTWNMPTGWFVQMQFTILTASTIGTTEVMDWQIV